MPIIGGVTPKGTIFVRNFDVNGRLLSKRVLKNHTQYDTLFNPKTKKYKMMLTTDWVTQRQFMQLAANEDEMVDESEFKNNRT